MGFGRKEELDGKRMSKVTEGGQKSPESRQPNILAERRRYVQEPSAIDANGFEVNVLVLKVTGPLEGPEMREVVKLCVTTVEQQKRTGNDEKLVVFLNLNGFDAADPGVLAAENNEHGFIADLKESVEILVLFADEGINYGAFKLAKFILKMDAIVSKINPNLDSTNGLTKRAKYLASIVRNYINEERTGERVGKGFISYTTL